MLRLLLAFALTSAACTTRGGGAPGDASVDADAEVCASRSVDLLVVASGTYLDYDLIHEAGGGAAVAASLTDLGPEILRDLRLGLLSGKLGVGGVPWVRWVCSGVAGESLGDGALLLTSTPPYSDRCDPQQALGLDEWPTFLSGSQVTRPGPANCLLADGLRLPACEVPQPLEAAARAPATNPGFVRPGSVLAILIMAGHDDFSTADPTLWDEAHAQETSCLLGYRSPEYLVPPLDYVARLQETHPDGPVVVGVLSGGRELIIQTGGECAEEVVRVCPPVGGIPVYPSPRLASVVEASQPGRCPGFRALWLDYCATDLEAELARFMAAVAEAAGSAAE